MGTNILTWVLCLKIAFYVFLLEVLISSSVLSPSRRCENMLSQSLQSIGEVNASAASKASNSFSIVFLRPFIFFPHSISFMRP